MTTADKLKLFTPYLFNSFIYNVMVSAVVVIFGVSIVIFT